MTSAAYLEWLSGSVADRARTPLKKRAPLTSRQRSVLDIICRELRAGRPAPTLREMGAELGIKSTNGVTDHLVSLERKGLIKRGEAQSRYIEVTPAGWAAMDLEPADPRMRSALAVVRDLPVGSVVSVSITPQMADLLGGITASGLYGTTREEVVERLLAEAIRQASMFTRGRR